MKRQTRSRKVEQSGETLVCAEPGVALGNRASLNPDHIDHQLDQFARRLISNPPYATVSICIWVLVGDVSRTEPCPALHSQTTGAGFPPVLK